MANTKYEKQYADMMKLHSDTFSKLKELSSDKDSEEFKEVQQKALRIVRKNEDKLCSKTENTKFSNFSTNLADKFWELIRLNFPEIDYSE